MLLCHQNIVNIPCTGIFTDAENPTEYVGYIHSPVMLAWGEDLSAPQKNFCSLGLQRRAVLVISKHHPPVLERLPCHLAHPWITSLFSAEESKTHMSKQDSHILTRFTPAWTKRLLGLQHIDNIRSRCKRKNKKTLGIARMVWEGISPCFWIVFCRMDVNLFLTNRKI